MLAYFSGTDDRKNLPGHLGKPYIRADTARRITGLGLRAGWDTRDTYRRGVPQIPCSGKIFSWMVSTWRRAYSAAHRRVSSGSSTGGSQRVIA